jgi:hypothetical protein
MAMKKNPVSGKTVKTTTYSVLTPFKKTEKMVNERTTRKPVAKKTADPSKTKPFNVKLIKPSEIIKDKAKAKPATKTVVKKAGKK